MSSSDDVLTGIGAFFGALLLALAVNALFAWPAMLLLGMIHHSYDARVPALGFWTVLLLGVVFRLMLMLPSSSKES